MKEVILNGFIGDKYGRHWTIKADRPHDVFSCIEANYPSFRKDMIEYIESGGGIDVQCGDRFLEEEDLLFSIPEDSMIITPIPGGAKSGGAKLLLAALIVASFFIPGTGGAGVSAFQAIQAGASLNITGQIAILVATNLAIMGITQMMAPDVEAEGDAEDNYLFNGPQNTVPQNNIVPVLMGEMIVGGVIIASGTVSGLQNRQSTFVVSIPGTPSTGGSGGGGGGGGTFNPTFPDGIPVTDIDTIPGGRDIFERVLY